MLVFLRYFLAFLIGSAFGSFFNVYLFRKEKNEDFIKGRSHCPYCYHQLLWWQLIPIFSYFLLKGRCYFCKKRISFQYPLVEFLTGIFFVLILWRFFSFSFFPLIFKNFNVESLFILVNLGFWFYWVSVLILIAFYDLRNYVILSDLIFPALFISLVWRILEGIVIKYFRFEFLLLMNQPLKEMSFLFGSWPYFLSFIYGIIFGGGFLFLIVFLTKEKAMGWGDVILSLFLGIILGWPMVLIALILSFLSGGFISLILIFLKKKTFKNYIPFGPFLAFSGLATLLLGDIIIKAYLSFI
ncbi:MAG: A24 family peptidase [Candidatus Paceibacterota bacterium]